jgi:hypothetical protein
MSNDIKLVNSSDHPRQVTEINRKQKDKIAEIIDTKHRELWLAPTLESFIYGTTRALDFGDYWGSLGKKFGNNLSEWEWAVNRNADLFNFDELTENDDFGQPRYLTFRKAAMHVNHNSSDPQLAIGLVFDATLVMDKYGDTNVVILFGIDRLKAAGIARRLETYPDRVFTSMGCSIKSSLCTVCGKQIVKDSDICDCLKYHRGSRVKGRRAAELLQKMAFYEQSVVTTPACTNAAVLDAVAQIIPGRILKIASTEMGGEGDTIIRIMASLHQSIKLASSEQEKKILSNRLDALINKLESMTQVA